MFDNYQNNPSGSNPGIAPVRSAAQDIFADLEKNNSAQPTPSAVNNQSPVAARPPQFQPVAQAQPSPARQLYQQPAMPVPNSSGGSLKYLIIGLLTLVVLLGGAVWAYQTILVPKMKIPDSSNASVVNVPIVASSTASEETNAVQSAPETVIVPSTNDADLPNAIASSTATSTMPSEDLTVKIPDIGVTVNTPVASLDSDKDGLTDKEELQYGTNPNNPDTDGDGLNDGDEVHIWQTDPDNADTDGDGFKDGAEVKNGYNPKGAGKLPVKK